MILQTTNEWPSALPLPKIEHSGSPRHATLISSEMQSLIARRSRFKRSYANVSVSWTLTDAQMTAFETFFVTTLGNGTAQFKIELKYPLNSALTEWSVRFEGEYDATYSEGWWFVEAVLDIVNPINF